MGEPETFVLRWNRWVKLESKEEMEKDVEIKEGGKKKSSLWGRPGESGKFIYHGVDGSKQEIFYEGIYAPQKKNMPKKME